MGKGLKNVTMGSKYEFKPDRNPGPGYYNADNAASQTKFKTPAANFGNPTSATNRTISPGKDRAGYQPGPGAYAPSDINTFGKDVKAKVTMGSKYEFKPGQGPAPGQYDTGAADSIVKPKAKGGATIRQPTNTYQRPRENLPEPGSYAPADINTFGKNIKGNVTMGSKYQFKPAHGPAPGQYDADKAVAVTKPKTRGATIREEQYPEASRRPKEQIPDAGMYAP